MFVGIVGLLLRSLYEPDVATVANVGFPETLPHATEFADPALLA